MISLAFLGIPLGVGKDLSATSYRISWGFADDFPRISRRFPSEFATISKEVVTYFLMICLSNSSWNCSLFFRMLQGVPVKSEWTVWGFVKGCREHFQRIWHGPRQSVQCTMEILSISLRLCSIVCCGFPNCLQFAQDLQGVHYKEILVISLGILNRSPKMLHW